MKRSELIYKLNALLRSLDYAHSRERRFATEAESITQLFEGLQILDEWEPEDEH